MKGPRVLYVGVGDGCLLRYVVNAQFAVRIVQQEFDDGFCPVRSISQ